MASGIKQRLWDTGDIMKLIEQWEETSDANQQ